MPDSMRVLGSLHPHAAHVGNQHSAIFLREP
jgi:hypothetical protein